MEIAYIPPSGKQVYAKGADVLAARSSLFPLDLLLILVFRPLTMPTNALVW